MSCLIEFLSDTNQKSIINMIQNRDETYEKQLKSYGRLFSDQLKYCVDKSGNNCSAEDCVCRVACYLIKERINDWYEKEDLQSDLDDFFKETENCYNKWINSEITQALEQFKQLLQKDKYRIINKKPNTELCLKEVENRVFFRARPSNEYLTRKEIFHIPFNKRYLIPNQRFSLTGLPLLYLGNSIVDLLEEIGGNPKNVIGKLRVSSFEFKNIPDKGIEPPDRIFDLRCNLRKSLSFPHEFTKPAFFRNILSHICSFRKRKELENANFKEEYVIPQMLSIVLHEAEYDGICYYSTKPFHGYNIKDANSGSDIANCDENIRYRENIALFTKAEQDSNQQKPDAYDERLFDSMEISIPIAIENVNLDSIHENEIHKLCDAIKTRYNSLKSEYFDIPEMSTEDTLSNKQKTIAKKAYSISTFFSDVFQKLHVDDTPYTDTQFGKIHVQLLIGILNRLLVEISLDEDNSTIPSVKVSEEVEQ